MPTEYVAVDAAAEVACGLGANGAIACWGSFLNGPYALPVGDFHAITVASDYACAIGSDDRLTCWGAAPIALVGAFQAASAAEGDLCAIDFDGKIQCASGHTGPAVSGPADAFVSLSSGSGFCGVRADGTVSCWGSESATAAPVSGRFVSVDGDADTGCAIRRDGQAVCWRTDYSDLDPPRRQTRTLEGAFRAVTVGGQTSCGIKFDGSLSCWHGLSNAAPQDVPPGGYTALAAGWRDACAVRIDRALVCWGGGIAGLAIADGAIGVRPDVQPTTADALDVAVAPMETCVIRGDLTLGCTGGVAPPDGTFLRVVTTWGKACAIRTDRTLVCWTNDWSHFGSTALGPPPSGSFTDVGVGDGYACGLRTSGTLVCWGPAGETTAPSGTYIDINVTALDACGLKADGTTLCWGQDAAPSARSGRWLAIDDWCGIKSDNTIGCWATDVLPPPPGEFRAVHGTCGLRMDGTLACWGIGDWDGAGNPVLEPAPPTGAFVALDDNCAIRVDRTLVCWNAQGTFLPVIHAAVAPPTSWVAVDDVTFSWSGSGLLPVTSYDVDASWIEPATSIHGGRWLSATSVTSATVSINPGDTYCIGVVARDTAGFVSTEAYSDDCVVAPLDDTSFHRSPGWQRVSGASYYGSSAVRTSRAGATLTLPVAAMRLALVASTCPDCGTIEVLGQTVSLQSAAAVDRRVIEIDLCDEEEGCPDEPYEMLVTIRVVSDGRPVTIDGIAVG